MQLLKDKAPDYAMVVESNWPATASEKAKWKTELDGAGASLDDRPTSFTLRKPVEEDFNGNADKIAGWLSNTAALVSQLQRKSRKRER